MNDDEVEDIEIILHTNMDMTEITLVLRAKKPMDTETLCIELESLAHLLNKADTERNMPGVIVH